MVIEELNSLPQTLLRGTKEGNTEAKLQRIIVFARWLKDHHNEEGTIFWWSHLEDEGLLRLDWHICTRRIGRGGQKMRIRKHKPGVA